MELEPLLKFGNRCLSVICIFLLVTQLSRYLKHVLSLPLAGNNIAKMKTGCFFGLVWSGFFFFWRNELSSDSEYISFIAHLFIICYNKCSKRHAKYLLKTSTNQKLLTPLGIKNIDSSAILVLRHFIIFPASAASSVFHKNKTFLLLSRRDNPTPVCLCSTGTVS